MNQTISLTVLSQDESRVRAWAEVRQLLELQLALLFGELCRRLRRVLVRTFWT
jgi:hypothetical protein